MWNASRTLRLTCSFWYFTNWWSQRHIWWNVLDKSLVTGVLELFPWLCRPSQDLSNILLSLLCVTSGDVILILKKTLLLSRPNPIIIVVTSKLVLSFLIDFGYGEVLVCCGIYLKQLSREERERRQWSPICLLLLFPEKSNHHVYSKKRLTVKQRENQELAFSNEHEPVKAAFVFLCNYKATRIVNKCPLFRVLC